jgi:glutamate-1-semialdehyde 2,1-aminomutase
MCCVTRLEAATQPVGKPETHSLGNVKPQFSQSRQLYERALRVLPGGVSRNAVLRHPHPFYAAKGEGCYVTDIEGARRIDFANNMASLIHGHAHPAIVEAVTRQLQRGTAFTFATEAEVVFAEQLCARSPAFEKIRFVNSGTEAVMCCIKAARARTQRAKIAKVEGAYHGIYDYAEVSQTAHPSNWGEANHPRSVPVCRGTPSGALDDVIVIPFNDAGTALAILDQHAAELACVLVDPLPHRVGFAPASAEFIDALRHWTLKNGALLVFDEVITFRSEFGGAQQWFSARPDLTALGKVIGGGFPVGAIAGSNEAMEVFDPLAEKVLFPHSGTFSANPVTMAAGLSAMGLFDREEVARLNRLGERTRKQITEAICLAQIPACVTGAGSIFRIHMKTEAPANYREAFATAGESGLVQFLLDHLLANGIMLINSCSGTLSTPMTGLEIDRLSEVLLGGFRKIKEMGAEKNL